MAAKKTEGHEGFGAGLPPPNAKLKPSHSSRRLLGLDAEIGSKMRAMYDDLLEQPIPDRFVELLKQIDQGQVSRDQAPQALETKSQ